MSGSLVVTGELGSFFRGKEPGLEFIQLGFFLPGAQVSQVRMSFLGGSLPERTGSVPSLGGGDGVSACAVTAGLAVTHTYNVVPSFKCIRASPYRPLREFFVETERLSLPMISKRA